MTSEAEQREFLMKVKAMRVHQKRFFAADYGSIERSDALTQSKRYEGAVDAMIARLLSGQGQLSEEG